MVGRSPTGQPGPMTETLNPPAPGEPPAGTTRRFVRTDDGRIIAGVCSGLGRYTDIDPVLFRVTFGVLTVFGGAGIAVYALAWLLLPKEGAPQSAGERLIFRVRRSWLTRRAAGRVLLLVLAAVVLLGLGGDNGGALVVIGVVGAAVWLALRGRTPSTDPPAAAAVGWPADPRPAFPAEPAPPPSRLGRLTVSALLLVLGVAALLDTAGVVDVTATAVLALSLTVVGAGLVVGTWYGRSRGLVVLGAVLSLLLLAATALPSEVGAGTGSRTWAPQSVAELLPTYQVGVGEVELDLRDLPVAGQVDVRARVGLGSLLVTVPSGTRVRVVAHSAAGSTNLFGVTRDGLDVDATADQAPETAVPAGADAGVLVLDLRVGLGEVVVRRA